jgi:hypothetical protein
LDFVNQNSEYIFAFLNKKLSMAKKKHLRSKMERKSPRKSRSPSKSSKKTAKPFSPSKSSKKTAKPFSPSKSSKKTAKPFSPSKLSPSPSPTKLPTPIIVHRSIRGPSFIRGSPEPTIELQVPPAPLIEFLMPEFPEIITEELKPVVHGTNDRSKSFSYLDSQDFFMSQPSRYEKKVHETPLVSEFNRLRRAEKLKKILAMQMNEEKKKKSTKEKKGKSPKSPDPSPPFQRVSQSFCFK